MAGTAKTPDPTQSRAAQRTALLQRLPRSGRKAAGGTHGREAAAGWLFVSPMIILLGLFLVIPVIMAAWVSVSDWTGRGSPFSAGFVGVDNYATILTEPGLAQSDFGKALRNNSYYVLFVIPIQTAIALFLAVMVNRRILKGRGFFRVAFYFPSVTSSVAITVIFLFLFSASGAVNKALSAIGLNGPGWFSDPQGIIHGALKGLGVETAPAALTSHGFLGNTWWDWLAGPSPAMCVFIIMAVFTTSGTFMLLFISALQTIQGEIEEAGIMDGANGWQRFRLITLPMLKPTVFTVLTLGLIGTWQVFDQIYVGSKGGPAKTTVTPAYLSYTSSFTNNQWGRGAAIAFILFAIIVVMAMIQRFVLRERKTIPRRKRFYSDKFPMTPATTGTTALALEIPPDDGAILATDTSANEGDR